MMPRRHVRHRMQGMSLIEMIVALVLIGILAASTAIFLRQPMENQVSTRQMLQLTDEVDMVSRQLSRDLANALPNSVRVQMVGNVKYIEFLAVRASGQYRAADGAGEPLAGPTLCAGGNRLNFAAADNCFTTLGSITNGAQIVPGNDYVVINTTLNEYANGTSDGPNKSRITGYTAGVAGPMVQDQLRFNNWLFSPPVIVNPAQANRFHVISGPVTYECNPTLGVMRRYAGYNIANAQPLPPAGTPALIASAIADCGNTTGLASGGLGLSGGLLTLPLRLTRSNAGVQESVRVLLQIPLSVLP